jgi:hypothetical protein
MHEVDGKVLRYIPSLSLNSNFFETMARIINNKITPAVLIGNLDMEVLYYLNQFGRPLPLALWPWPKSESVICPLSPA